MAKLEENWKPVVGLVGRYEVSNRGRVRSLGRTRPCGPEPGMAYYPGKIMNQAVNRGYRRVSFRDLSGKTKLAQVHRLVLEAFVGPCPPGMECCHNNGDRADNRLENLRWDTSSANRHDSIRHGTHVCSLPGKKLSDAQVQEIRSARMAGETFEEIGRRLCVHRRTASSAYWKRDAYAEAPHGEP